MQEDPLHLPSHHIQQHRLVTERELITRGWQTRLMEALGAEGGTLTHYQHLKFCMYEIRSTVD
jgi:hypothetical protein